LLDDRLQRSGGIERRQHFAADGEQAGRLLGLARSLLVSEGGPLAGERYRGAVQKWIDQAAGDAGGERVPEEVALQRLAQEEEIGQKLLEGEAFALAEFGQRARESELGRVERRRADLIQGRSG